MFCSNCGKVIDQSSDFCSYCGERNNLKVKSSEVPSQKDTVDLNAIIDKCGNAKINAIKMLRDQTGLDLKEAKEMIDVAYNMKRVNPAYNLNQLLINGTRQSSNDSSSIAAANQSNKAGTGKVNDPRNLIRMGSVQQVWSAKGDRILKYKQDLFHDGLLEHKTITATDQFMLKNLGGQQIKKWEEKWKIESGKRQSIAQKKASSEEAASRTMDAEAAIQELENLLLATLDVNDAIDWDSIKNHDKFLVPLPQKPKEPNYLQYPAAPARNDPEFQPQKSLLSTVFKSVREKADAAADDLYNSAYKKWQQQKDSIIEQNSKLGNQFTQEMNTYNSLLSEWEEQKKLFLSNQAEFNARIDDLKSKYYEQDVPAIFEYCDMVLESSQLPAFIHKDYEIDYNPDTKILIIDYKLPSVEDIPNIKEVKYIAAKNELKTTNHTELFVERLYDSTIYKLILRVLHEEFEADIVNALDAISFNGWVNYLNKATGNREDACIVSIQVKKEAFLAIDLRHVDPKACFKNLKGVGSSKLAGITPIQPILTMNKEDKRFVVSYDVANSLDDTTNLAAIAWEDFEHLIREIFESEFSSNGGEVKVTQASRDGGVDAIAFDPDPIRGGKIVIQAKRYTNTVGVSAVRDLYGTVMNEGATKGILVTTADYGPDAYEFAKNKPLTLLNGSNLLHLLAKHGHKAKIDLMEAKALNKANN